MSGWALVHIGAIWCALVAWLVTLRSNRILRRRLAEYEATEAESRPKLEELLARTKNIATEMRALRELEGLARALGTGGVLGPARLPIAARQLLAAAVEHVDEARKGSAPT